MNVTLEFRFPPQSLGRLVRAQGWMAQCLAYGILTTAVAAQDAGQSKSSAKKVMNVSTAPSTRTIAPDVPEWAMRAKWYVVEVPVFFNGDKSNDPPGTAAWPSGNAASTRPVPQAAPQQFGGDLAGLAQRLPYLTDLGADTLYLASIFRPVGARSVRAVDLRHIADSLGPGIGDVTPGNETSDPKTWGFTESDRAFIKFIKQAHAAGFRIVVGAAMGRARQTIPGRAGDAELPFAIARRWMDPNSDGRSDDGVDGWVLERPGELSVRDWKRWRERVKRLNPEVLLVTAGQGDDGELRSAGIFDAAVDGKSAEAIRKFFRLNNGKYDPATLFADLSAARKQVPLSFRLASPILMSDPISGRLFSVLGDGGPDRIDGKAADPALEKETIQRWRLATVFQHFLDGAPVTYYGDEMGMRGAAGSASRQPMRWPDRPAVDGVARRYRDDFASLIQWLHGRRDVDEPLKRGEFRPMIAESDRKILAFARSHAGGEVILVLNYGSSKQLVMLPVGRPGEMIGVLSPILNPDRQLRFGRQAVKSPNRISPRRMGASRQVVNSDGLARIWVEPMSIRVAVSSEENRR